MDDRIHRSISKELDNRVKEIQEFMKKTLGIDLNYTQATKILARKIGLYKVPINVKEVKELKNILRNKGI